jgi:hypothetical protein
MTTDSGLDRVLANLPGATDPAPTTVTSTVPSGDNPGPEGTTGPIGDPTGDPVPPPAPVAPANTPDPVHVELAAPAAPVEPTPATTAWYDDQPPAAQDVPTAPQPGTLEYALPKELFEDEEFQLFVEAKKSGKTLLDIVNEFQVVDYTNLSPREVMERGLKELDGKAEDVVAEYLAQYDSLNIFEQEKVSNDMRLRYQNITDTKRKALTSGVEKSKQAQSLMQQKFISEVEQGTSQLVNQEIKGLKISAEMAEDLKRYALNEFNLVRADGTLDAGRILELSIWEKYGKDLVRANVTKARNEGREEVLVSITNPSPVATPAQVPVDGNGDISAAIKAYANKP